MNLAARLKAYARLIRLDKPIGALLLLWPTLWGLWLGAGALPDTHVLVVFMLGTLLTRSAGCAINDYADRHFDGRVARTRERPIAAGLIKPKEALMVAAVLALIAFALVLTLNRLTVALALVAALIAAIYPFTKRFLALPQVWLGVAFSFGIPMAFAAQTGTVPAIAWALLIANVFWTIAYDTEYAMVDREDDLKLGIQTAALTFGRYDVAAVMGCHGAFLLLMTLIGLRSGLGFFYFCGLAVAAILIMYQYFLIRDRDPARCFRAFRHNNWVGLSVFLGVAGSFHVPSPFAG
jgi:4-hydroxybenzoate polyprenyltransferase